MREREKFFFINNKMNEIFGDFIKKIEQLNYFCELKDLRFDGEKIPNYNNIIIQQCYLLRYLPAYFMEYYMVYKIMIDEKLIDDNLKVVSMGSGCDIDYWGLYYAVREKFDNIDISYVGADKINWKYIEKLPNTRYKHKIKNIEMFRGFGDNVNVIVFPKSIGEFDGKCWEHINKMIIKTNFRPTSLVIISFNRKTRQNLDGKRFEEIVQTLISNHNYKTDYSINKHYNCGAGSIKSDYPYFNYPDEIKEYITELSRKCPEYVKNGESCEQRCNALDRWPILNFKYTDFQIVQLYK